ncbi:PD-(D/E)XK nuclease family transposase [Clostridium sp.]|uniref:PD-(D/E)XK nuclease family transposase n=1 Tax=Clostridium sp. TaxID=1506 RepID=UPI00260CDDAB|nr:PD-(D/E)XK nuclease family transposase [Clostridium sp.]
MCKLNPKVDFAFKKLFGSEENNEKTKEEFSDLFEIHFIELNKFKKDYKEIKTALDRWVSFLNRAYEIELMTGEMPNKQLKMLFGWTALHQEELQEEWYLARLQKELFPIEPLK